MFKKLLNRRVYLLVLSAFLGGIIIYYFNGQLEEFEQKKHEDDLANAHQVAVKKFSESINRFAYLMSGMRSYLRYVDSFPPQKELQSFLSYQTNELNFTDSLVVSFLNTKHEFVYSFNKDKINPSGLIGTSVTSFRNNTEINRLEDILLEDNMKLFPPINLIEGWVGIPLNFPVTRDDKVVGYIASLLNFRNIIEPIYKLEQSNLFVYQFSVKGKDFFDREQVHDNSKVYHNRKDEKFFRNYNLPEENFIVSDVNAYGLTFTIGTAYIRNEPPNPYTRWAFLIIYILLFSFAAFAIYRYEINRQLNERLKKVNALTKKQNSELKEINATKNRLMSIVGHDLKGPISSIINLISLVDEEAVSMKDTKLILKQLNPVAKNTINLLENLLQWAMVNSDQTLFKPELIKVENLVDENLVLLKSVADQKNIKCLKDVPKTLNVFADYNMFSTILRNLISNAIKYSDVGTKVTISGWSEGQNSVIEVTDEGVGMSEKEINAINNLELEASKKGTAGEKGTGLGLTLCKAFISKHGGSLEIQSEKEKGSTFKIIIPNR